ncbi:hypothetical protein KR009_000632, partial [Drosophila setifemur]
VIGSGFFGRVYKAQWRQSQIAVKMIRVGCEDTGITREVNQLSKASHKNIIKLYGVSQHDDLFYLMVEYLEGGSLSSYLHADWKPKYTLAHALNWAWQIAQGVAYLHAMKPKAVIHRDIKPGNVLLGDKGRILKICDFGTVVDITLSMSASGTCSYKAPEVFDGFFTEKCDVHSWAITLWEILSRKVPFAEIDTVYEINLTICGGVRPKIEDVMNGCPDDIISLMIASWTTDPRGRFSMKLIATILEEFVSKSGPIEPLEYIF